MGIMTVKMYGVKMGPDEIYRTAEALLAEIDLGLVAGVRETDAGSDFAFGPLWIETVVPYADAVKAVELSQWAGAVELFPLIPPIPPTPDPVI